MGTGWTVFNNKGKPVRQFEPFFTATHRFESDVRVGVSPILFYDPVQRVVATLNPNHSWQKVLFDSWHQETWDVNDTVLVDNPGDDPYVGDFFGRLSADDYLPTWHEVRIAGALGTQEQTAAQQNRIPREHSRVAQMDSLGRTFVTIAHNRLPRGGIPVEEFYRTRVVYDIEGNQRDVIDAKDRVVMHDDYDVLGSRIHSTSIDAGERWMLNDVVGQPIRGMGRTGTWVPHGIRPTSSSAASVRARD